MFKGTDADADTRLVGSARTASSPTTGAAQAAVLQQIGNSPVAGVIYRIGGAFALRIFDFDLMRRPNITAVLCDVVVWLNPTA